MTSDHAASVGRPLRLRLVARLMLLGAVLWSATIVVLGFTLPVYGESSAASTAGGPVTSVDRTLTLVEANGPSAAVVLLVPLAVSVAVAVLLRLGGGRARTAAWVLSGLLVGLSVLALMSIGLFVVPVGVALLVACTSARTSAYWDRGLGAPGR